MNEKSTDIVTEALDLVTFPRTATMKVVGDESKLRLFVLFNQFSDACAKVKDKVNALKEDDATKPIYDDFVEMFQRGRGATTAIWTELDPDKKYTAENSFPSKYRGTKGFPLYRAPKEGYDFTTSGYHYSANAAVHIALDSLNECDKLCNAEYTALKKEVDALDAQLREDYDEPLVDKFYIFVEKTMAMGWSYDGNFQKYFAQIMAPALRNGETSYGKTYKLGDKNKRYSFYSTSVPAEITKHPEYWDILADETAVKYYNANRLLMRKKEHAQYTPTTLNKAQVRPFFGNNGIKFSIAADGDGYAYMSYKLPSLNGEKPEAINVQLAYRKYYDGNPRKSCYLDGLTITDNDNGMYTCKYSINGKHPQTAILKECFMRLVIHNGQWFKKYIAGTLTKEDGVLQPSYFDLYMDLSLGITETPIHNLTKKEVFGKGGLRAYYSTAYPEVKDLGLQSSVADPFPCPISKPHNLMGIDLGQRNPFGYCIKDEKGIEIVRGHLDGADNDNYKKYIIFGNQCEYVIQLIKETKNYLYGDEEAIDPENYTLAMPGVPYEDYIKYLAPKRTLVNTEDQSKNQTHTMRVDRMWALKEAVWQLTCQYHALNKGRYNDNDWRQTLYWIDAIYRFIDLQKAFHNFGSYYDHATKTKVNGTGRGFCSGYWEHIDNLNRDTFKKFAYELLPIIKKHGVSVICLEELRSMYGDKLRSTNDNRMYNLWPVGQLKTFLEGVLAPYNMVVIEVSEQDTSQIIDGKWAVRNKDILTNGEKTVHADEQAAENIVDRALTHHTNLYSMYMVCPMDDYWVPNQIWSPKEKGGKRVRGFLTKTYGSSGIVFARRDGKLIKSEMNIKDLRKLAGKKKVSGEYWYRVNGSEWVDAAGRETITSKISA